MAARKLEIAGKAAEAKPYRPTPFEADGVRAYVAARAKRGPRLKVTAGVVKIDHPDPGTRPNLIAESHRFNGRRLS